MKEIIEKDKSGYEEMDVESAELIEVLTKTKGKRNGGTVNMCKAFEDHYKSGIIQGQSIGETLKLINLIIKKISKSKSLEAIADELEEKPEDIQQLYNVAYENQNLSADEIYSICYK